MDHASHMKIGLICSISIHASMSLLRKKYNSIPSSSLTLASMLCMNFSSKQTRNQDSCFTFGLPPIQKLWKIYASFVKRPPGLCKFYMGKCKRKFAIFMPPFNEVGVYCFAHVGRWVRRSIYQLEDLFLSG